MRLLLIDTSTERGVLAYADHQQVIFAEELPVGLNQSKFLMPTLTEVFNDLPALDAIGVGIGPGSYTGIRLGVAVAQALAYSWQVPLVGVSSLQGFVPFETSVHFAAILDARIGGVYFQKGWNAKEGVRYEEDPQVCALEEVGEHLQQVTHLVTPMAKSLQAKLRLHYPHQQWEWQERAPSVPALLQRVEQLYAQGKFVVSPQHLELLYLRQTEAEREKRAK